MRNKLKSGLKLRYIPLTPPRDVRYVAHTSIGKRVVGLLLKDLNFVHRLHVRSNSCGLFFTGKQNAKD